MKNILRAALFLILLISADACSMRVSSPAIWAVNQSDDYIRNIKVNWNGYNLGVWTSSYPGQGGSQNFTLNKKSDLYGPVHIEWENAEGKIITKEFEFKKEMLPDFRKGLGLLEFGFAYEDIYFFITQSNVKIIIDPTGKGSEQITKERQIANNLSSQFFKICPKHFGCDLKKLKPKSKNKAL